MRCGVRRRNVWREVAWVLYRAEAWFGVWRLHMRVQKTGEWRKGGRWGMEVGSIPIEPTMLIMLTIESDRLRPRQRARQ